jgi:hypothetical protein
MLLLLQIHVSIHQVLAANKSVLQQQTTARVAMAKACKELQVADTAAGQQFKDFLMVAFLLQPRNLFTQVVAVVLPFVECEVFVDQTVYMQARLQGT